MVNYRVLKRVDMVKDVNDLFLMILSRVRTATREDYIPKDRLLREIKLWEGI